MRPQMHLLLICGLVATAPAWAQAVTITGSVVLPDGTPARGATVMAVNNAAAEPFEVRTVTGDDGGFTLSIAEGQALLGFAIGTWLEGYASDEVTVFDPRHLPDPLVLRLAHEHRYPLREREEWVAQQIRGPLSPLSLSFRESPDRIPLLFAADVPDAGWERHPTPIEWREQGGRIVAVERANRIDALKESFFGPAMRRDLTIQNRGGDVRTLEVIIAANSANAVHSGERVDFGEWSVSTAFGHERQFGTFAVLSYDIGAALALRRRPGLEVLETPEEDIQARPSLRVRLTLTPGEAIVLPLVHWFFRYDRGDQHGALSETFSALRSHLGDETTGTQADE